MSSSISSLAKDLHKIFTESDRKTKGYDTQATVLKVGTGEEEGTIWVKIPGGVDATPVRKTIDAKEGDEVQVRVSGGSAWVLGNSSRPPTDDSIANVAIFVSNKASDQAENAIQFAGVAKSAALDAQAAAGAAIEYAEVAYDAAEDAKESADEAKESAADAFAYADVAYEKSVEAVDSAREANYAANGALTQLSVVEDVVGTLNWVSKHGKYDKTEDTELDPNKTYFIKVNSVYTPVVNPEESQLTRYYELTLDDSIQNYISTHLALTDEGLYVVKDNLGYKILLANDGMKVYDDKGHLVSTFGESIKFSSDKAQYIGSNDAFIAFDPVTRQISIGGNVVMGGDLTLDKFLSEVNSLEVDYTLNSDASRAFFTARIFRGHDDVTSQFDPRCFTWFQKTESGEVPLYGNNGTNIGYTMVVDIDELFDFEGHVITHFTHSYVDYFIDNGHAYVKADSVDVADIGEFGFTIDEYGDLIYSYDNDTVADFEIVDGRLKALTQYGIFGNKLTRETAVYKKDAFATVFSEIAATNEGIDLRVTGAEEGLEEATAAIKLRIKKPENDEDKDEFLSYINAIADRIILSAKQIRFTENTTVDGQLGELASAISFDTVNKTITIGNAEGFHILITPNELGFYMGENNKMAYVNSSDLYVVNSLSFGTPGFGFTQRDNGHFTLKLVDAE